MTADDAYTFGKIAAYVAGAIPIIAFLVMGRFSRLFFEKGKAAHFTCQVVLTIVFCTVAWNTVPSEEVHRRAFRSYHPVQHAAGSVLELVGQVEYGCLPVWFYSVGLTQLNYLDEPRAFVTTIGFFGKAWCIDDPELHRLLQQLP